MLKYSIITLIAEFESAGLPILKHGNEKHIMCYHMSLVGKKLTLTSGDVLNVHSNYLNISVKYFNH